MDNQEREAIVDWLRLYAADADEPHTGTARKALSIAADTIERGTFKPMVETYHWLGAEALK